MNTEQAGDRMSKFAPMHNTLNVFCFETYHLKFSRLARSHPKHDHDKIQIT